MLGLLKGLSRSLLTRLSFGPREPLSEEPPPEVRRERLCGLSSALLRDCEAGPGTIGYNGTGVGGRVGG